MALTRLVNDYKDSVRLASTGANINLAAAPNTLDGVSLSLNDRVLVKDQTPTSLNGIYRVTTLGTGSNGSWTRSSDFNDWREISPGAMVFVEAGSINGNAFYFINGGGSNVTIGTTAINFSNLYSVNGNVTSFPGNVNVAGTLTVVGNIISQSYETVTLTEYANSLIVTGNIDVTNSGNINIGAGGNIYMGSTALPRFRTGNTAPASPNLGDTWYQGNTDILYEYIQDANNNKYWLDLSSNPSSYGNLTVANILTLNGNLTLPVTSLQLTGGTSGYVLRTDGNGGLSWVAVSATAGGSNTYVQFNDGGSLGGATYIQYNKTSGNLVSNSTTTSTTTTTGALVLGGGIGVGGNINTAGYIVANGAFNESTTTPGVYIGNLNATARIGFFNGNASANWQIDNSLGTFRWYTPGVTRMSIDYGGNLTLPGAMLITNTSTSTSATTGALTVSGGVGVAGSVYANIFNGVAVYAGTIGNSSANHFGSTVVTTGNIYSGGNIIAASTTTSTSKTTGAMVVSGSGGVGVGGNVFANAFYSDYHLFANGVTITTPAGGSNSMVQFNDGSNFSGATFLQYNKTSGNLVSNSTTTSTSKTTGAIVLGGGIGVGGNVFANAYYSDYYLYSNGNVLKSGSTFTTSNTAPSGAVVGDWWYKGNTDVLYNYVKDAANNQFWLDLSSTTNTFGNLTATNLTVTNAAISTVTQTFVPSSNASINIGSASSGYFNAIYAVTFSGTSTTAKYADLAEMYHADDHYMPGTVVVFGGDFDVTISNQTHDSRVAGVISTNPAYLMNDNFEHDTWVPVALTGRVPCKVRGPVSKGDLLVSSEIPGVAQKLDKDLYSVGCIIGKSIDIITDNSVKKIEIAVGRF